MQAGGRRFDPVNLHQPSNLSERAIGERAIGERAIGVLQLSAPALRLFRFGRYDHWLFLFFNNLEEVVKNSSVQADAVCEVLRSVLAGADGW